MTDDEAADVYLALSTAWPDATIQTIRWHDGLLGLAYGPTMAAIQEIKHREEPFPSVNRVKSVANGYANLDKGVCTLCNNTGFVFEAEPANTVRPCDKCRPEVYARWLTGAYQPTNTGGAPRDELENLALRARLDEMRGSLRSPV